MHLRDASVCEAATRDHLGSEAKCAIRTGCSRDQLGLAATPPETRGRGSGICEAAHRLPHSQKLRAAWKPRAHTCPPESGSASPNSVAHWKRPRNASETNSATRRRKAQHVRPFSHSVEGAGRGGSSAGHAPGGAGCPPSCLSRVPKTWLGGKAPPRRDRGGS